MRSSTRKSVAVAVALFVSIGLCAARSAAAGSDWRTLRSPNFLLVGNANEGSLRRVAGQLERFRVGMVQIAPQVRVDSPVPTTVYVFRDQNSFRPFKPKVDGKTRDQVAGYFLTLPEGNYVALAADRQNSEGHQVIFHEYLHFLTRGSGTGRLPLWLNEGLAEFYSTFDTLADGRTVRIGNLVPWHVILLRRGALVPFQTLLSAGRGSPYYKGGLKTGQLYAESWLLTHYLMLGNEGKNRAGIGTYVRLTGEGKPVEEAFREAFGMDFKTAERELHSYLNKSLLPVMTYSLKVEPIDEGSLKAVAIDEGEALAYQVDLSIRMGLLAEADAMFAKAAERGASSTRLQRMTGLLRARQGRYDEAVGPLREAAEKDTDDYLAHYYLGNVLAATGKYAEAVASYQAAVRLKPDMAELYTGLGLAYSALGQDAEAVAAFDTTARLAPGDADVYRRRAYAALGAGRGERAAADALEYLKRAGWDEESSPYMALVGHFGYRTAKREAAAKMLLAEAARKLPADAWIAHVVSYLRRDVSAPDLLARAKGEGELTEAHAYIGLDLVASGDSKAGSEHLRWVVEKGAKNYVEYDLAAKVLRRLGAAPAAEVRK
jgi:lipoprotein NlpI